MPESNGQKPITGIIAAWIMLLVFGWAGNSIIIKVIVEDIPPYWAAFLRFGLAFPFLAIFIFLKKVKLKTNLNELWQIACLAILTFTQISLFNGGAKYTTGGRITLILFSYPLMIPILAHFVIKEEKLRKRTLTGCLLAFIGLFLPIHHSIFNDNSKLVGDLMMFASSITLTFLIVFSKKVISKIDKWRVIFWQTMIASSLFLASASIFEKWEMFSIKPITVYSLAYQVLIINTFCFLSYQFILARHNSSQIAIFFFATPLIGMLMGVIFLTENFEWIVLAGCLFVGAGIYIANTKKEDSDKEVSPELESA